MKTRLITLLKFAISFAILGFLFYKAQQRNEFTQIMQTQKNWGWIAFGVAAGLSAALVSFFRWFVLIRALSVPLKLIDAIRLGFLGNLFNLMSIGVLGGDALKSVFVARHVGHKKTEAVLSVFADRVVGLLTMFSVAAVAYWTVDLSQLGRTHPQAFTAIGFVCQAATIAAVIGWVFGIALLVSGDLSQKRILKPLTELRFVGGLFAKVFSVLLSYRRRPGSLVAAVFLSVMINALFAAAIYGVAAGISDAHPTMAQHFVIAPIAMLANAVPLPGGLGGMEAALDFLYLGFSGADIPTEHGFVVALGFRLILLLVAVIGVFVYVSHRKEIKSLQADMNVHPEPKDRRPEISIRATKTGETSLAR